MGDTLRGERLGHMLLVEGSWPRTVLGASGSANCMTSFTTSCRATTLSSEVRPSRAFLCLLARAGAVTGGEEQQYLGIGGVVQS